MKKLISLLLPLIALIGGVMAGDMLRPATEATAATPSDAQAAPDDHADAHSGAVEAGEKAWFTFPNQFFVPMMRNGDMGAVMILTLSLETQEADMPTMQAQEHKLRDALLRRLMIHANTGGFDGNFTSETNLQVLREGLLTAVTDATDLPISAVLIEDIARQAG